LAPGRDGVRGATIRLVNKPFTKLKRTTEGEREVKSRDLFFKTRDCATLRQGKSLNYTQRKEASRHSGFLPSGLIEEERGSLEK